MLSIIGIYPGAAGHFVASLTVSKETEILHLVLDFLLFYLLSRTVGLNLGHSFLLKVIVHMKQQTMLLRAFLT